MNDINKQKGFTILIAVVTAGILLIIAMSIGGLALKEQILSTANKESLIAFYAADTGMECALYSDQKKGLFGPDSDGNPPAVVPTISCNNQTITPELSVNSTAPSPNTGNDLAKYSYSFMVSNIPVGNPANNVYTCAVVTITKDTNDVVAYPQDSTKTHTNIMSYGYNTCDASLSRLERGVRSDN
jgi:hypothetical protein